jgi:hypothetical protein
LPLTELDAIADLRRRRLSNLSAWRVLVFGSQYRAVAVSRPASCSSAG